MEDLTLDNNLNDGITLDTATKNYLKETAKWAKFLSILGFVMIGLFVLIGLFAGSFVATLMNSGGVDMPIGFSGGFFTILYVCMGLLYFMPCLYLYRFATKMQKALANDNQTESTEAFMNLKSLYKFMGILMVIILGFYALMLVISLVGVLMVG